MAGEWIPVKERLPKESGWYLVTVRLGGENFEGKRYAVRTEYFGRGRKWESFFYEDIVAWMPLAEPWVPENEQAADT